MSAASLALLDAASNPAKLAATREALGGLLDLCSDLYSAADCARVERAAEWMVALHLPQEDRKDGQPYVSHTTEVARRVLAWCPDAPADVVIAALLHDSVEDQARAIAARGTTSHGALRQRALAVLSAELGPEVARRVALLSNPESDAQAATTPYAEHVAHAVHADGWVAAIKLADFSTNAFALARVTEPAVRDRLVRKYRPVMEMFRALVHQVPADHPLAGSRDALSAQLQRVWARDYAR